MALEEVLDRAEGWRRGRHSGDYWVAVFGDPAGDAPWSLAVRGPPRVGDDGGGRRRRLAVPGVPRRQPGTASTTAGTPVVPPARARGGPGPRAARRAGPAGRAAAIVADGRAGGHPQRSVGRARQSGSSRLGVAARRPTRAGARPARPARRTSTSARLPAAGRPRADRLPAPSCTSPGPARPTPGTRHYYRVQGDDLLIEYDNTSRRTATTRTRCSAVPAPTSATTCWPGTGPRHTGLRAGSGPRSAPRRGPTACAPSRDRWPTRPA